MKKNEEGRRGGGEEGRERRGGGEREEGRERGGKREEEEIHQPPSHPHI